MLRLVLGELIRDRRIAALLLTLVSLPTLFVTVGLALAASATPTPDQRTALDFGEATAVVRPLGVERSDAWAANVVTMLPGRRVVVERVSVGAWLSTSTATRRPVEVHAFDVDDPVLQGRAPLRAGGLPSGRDVLLSVSLADALDARVGSTLLSSEGELRVSGILDPRARVGDAVMDDSSAFGSAAVPRAVFVIGAPPSETESRRLTGRGLWVSERGTPTEESWGQLVGSAFPPAVLVVVGALTVGASACLLVASYAVLARRFQGRSSAYEVLGVPSELRSALPAVKAFALGATGSTAGAVAGLVVTALALWTSEVLGSPVGYGLSIPWSLIFGAAGAGVLTSAAASTLSARWFPPSEARRPARPLTRAQPTRLLMGGTVVSVGLALLAGVIARTGRGGPTYAAVTAAAIVTGLAVALLAVATLTARCARHRHAMPIRLMMATRELGAHAQLAVPAAAAIAGVTLPLTLFAGLSWPGVDLAPTTTRQQILATVPAGVDADLLTRAVSGTIGGGSPTATIRQVSAELVAWPETDPPHLTSRTPLPQLFTGDVASLQAVLGRPLTPAERAAWDGGSLMVTTSQAVRGGQTLLHPRDPAAEGEVGVGAGVPVKAFVVDAGASGSGWAAVNPSAATDLGLAVGPTWVVVDAGRRLTAGERSVLANLFRQAGVSEWWLSDEALGELVWFAAAAWLLIVGGVAMALGVLASPGARQRSSRLHELGEPPGSIVAMGGLMNAVPLTVGALAGTLPVFAVGAVIGQLSPEAFPWHWPVGVTVALLGGPFLVGSLAGAWLAFRQQSQ